MDDRAVGKPLWVGTFETVAGAERAVRSLLAAGFTREQLAVICSDKSKEQFFANLPAPELAGPHPGRWSGWAPLERRSAGLSCRRPPSSPEERQCSLQGPPWC